MLAFSSAEMVEATDAARCHSHHMSQAAPVRSLATSEVLFQNGDTHAVYRVERGALCHYIRWDDGDRHEIIEFAFPGDIIGFGHLKAHISTAQAMMETEVSAVAPHDFERALEADGRLATRVAAAADREFDYLRARAARASQGWPAERVASLLAALSHMSASEGRDPKLIPDEIASGVVAERLHMTIDCLAQTLKELERRGLLTPSAAGLRIVDVGALERFAEAPSGTA